jgi:L-fuconolactonase
MHNSTVPMIDAHFHIWQLTRADYGWLTPALGAIFRDVALNDWRAVSAPCGVRGGVLVQAAPTEAETRFLLQQAKGASDVLGVVGWADMLAGDAPGRIADLASEPKLKALRPMLQDIPDPDWILQDALLPAFEAMLRCELAFDALVKPVHLPRIAALARRHPALRIVIDHGAKPDIARGRWSDWTDALDPLVQLPQVVCKLSGLWNEAGTQAPVEALEPYARHVLTRFGASRVMWGSDWPVLERAGDYATWHTAARRWVMPADHAEVFAGAARTFYRL